ncbi:MAG TPA: hypothetical protein VNB24_05135 [Acidimicrobiales bacterium]|nr:hypothetical protein [Acidimicrobiales bacterium]
MTPEETATAVAPATSALTSRFMLDGATYARGGKLGFEGMAFYAAGRGGVLGDVHSDVVSAAFVFFNPDTVRAAWDSSATVAPRHEAAAAFAECCHEWGRSHLPDDLDAERLAALGGKVSAAASPAGAPVFAGWRALPVPSDAKAAAVHHMNSLRELRMAKHAVAVLATGIHAGDAVRMHTPHMAALFGWTEPLADDAPVVDWDAIEARTNELCAPDFAVLDAEERAEFAALVTAANDRSA